MNQYDLKYDLLSTKFVKLHLAAVARLLRLLPS